MIPDETNAWIRLQVEADMLCARIEMEGMLAENQTRAHAGLSPAYNEVAFTNLIKEHGIGHDDVIRTFSECH